MGATSCCGLKRSSAATTQENVETKKTEEKEITPELAECHSTSLFNKPEEELMHAELICSICLSVVRNAVRDPCGHVFGEYCIKHWLQKNPKCPYSQISLTFTELRPDELIRSKVQAELQQTNYNQVPTRQLQLLTLKVEPKSENISV